MTSLALQREFENHPILAIVIPAQAGIQRGGGGSGRPLLHRGSGVYDGVVWRKCRQAWTPAPDFAKR